MAKKKELLVEYEHSFTLDEKRADLTVKALVMLSSDLRKLVDKCDSAGQNEAGVSVRKEMLIIADIIETIQGVFIPSENEDDD